MIWMRLLWFSFVVIIPFVSTNENSSTELSCKLHDSINITNGHYNGTKIIFDGHTFESEQYATVKYALDSQSKVVSVESHVRGCICNIRPCIRTCCPDGFVRIDKNGATDCVPNDDNKNAHYSVRLRKIENENNETVSAMDHFTVVHSHPPDCLSLTQLYNFSINPTGDAIAGTTKIPHSRYCIDFDFNANTTDTTESLLFCEVPDQSRSVFDDGVVPYCLLFAIPFMIATVLVYRFVPELYSLHGKCLLCYLISLIFGFLVTGIVRWNFSLHVIACHTFGWIIYFAYIAAFLWLSAICYDLWSNLRMTKGYQKYSDGRLFIFYFAYAIGIATTLTIISMAMNYTELLPKSLRPQIGDEICFIKQKFAKGFYFYGPLAIIFSINVFLFLLMALKIRQLQSSMRMSSAEEITETHARNLGTNDEKCILYFQLFVVMGIPWLMEVLTFFSETLNGSIIISKFFDLINAIQGVLIFALMVLSPCARKLIKKRWQQYKGTKKGNKMSNTKESNPLNMIRVN